MLAGLLALIAFPFLAFFALIETADEWGAPIVSWFRNRRDRRRARIEAELDRKQEELRGTILQLADALGMEAHEARKALIRESYLRSGRTPDSTT